MGLGATAAGYGVGTAAVLTLMQSGNPFLTILGSFVAILLWLAKHRARVRRPGVRLPRETPRNRQNERAVEYARYRRTLRDQARALAAEDPALARELRIGRPDAPRTYDDGGLVDVNHAPREIIEALPGMTPELADRVLRRRRGDGRVRVRRGDGRGRRHPGRRPPLMADFTIFLR